MNKKEKASFARAIARYEDSYQPFSNCGRHVVSIDLNTIKATSCGKHAPVISVVRFSTPHSKIDWGKEYWTIAYPKSALKRMAKKITFEEHVPLHGDSEGISLKINSHNKRSRKNASVCKPGKRRNSY